jgi:hypothetical protein
MIKPKKKQPQNLQDLQNDNIELEKTTKDPLYFYNTYIRKEGQPVLNKEEYDKLVKEWEEARYTTILRDRKGNIIHMRPLIPKEISKKEDNQQ